VREKMFKSVKNTNDKQMIDDAVKRFTNALGMIHQKYMGSEKDLYNRSIDYSQEFNVIYSKLQTEIKCDIPVSFELHKGPLGLTLCITKGDLIVQQYISYPPYYMTGPQYMTGPHYMQGPQCMSVPYTVNRENTSRAKAWQSLRIQR